MYRPRLRGKEKDVTELGKKFNCYKCGCKFYDLNKPDPICPKCGEDQTNEETKKILKRKKRRALAKGKVDVRQSADDVDGMADSEDEVEEYILDMEDIVLEENGEYVEKETDYQDEE